MLILNSTFVYNLEISDGIFKTITLLVIELVDANDHAPMFDQSLYVFYLDENTPTEPVVYVGAVGATDEDSSSNGEVRPRV